MAETSSMLPLGTQLADFTLIDVVASQPVSLSAIKSPIATVVMFICNHCPYVKHIQLKIVEIAKKYGARGITFLAINSNDIERYPADSPDHMREEAARLGYPFPYLFDEGQTVAKAFHAACTPDFYVLDGALKCVYRGRFDGATPGNHLPVTGAELSAALDQVLTGKLPPAEDQKPSMGCSIKWK